MESAENPNREFPDSFHRAWKTPRGKHSEFPTVPTVPAAVYLKKALFLSEEWGAPHFEYEWQTFRTKKDRSRELMSVFHECPPGRRRLAVKVVDIFGNDMMTIVEVMI